MGPAGEIIMVRCSECDGKCCRYFCFEIDEPDSMEEFEDIRWYVLHEGVSVHVDEGDWYISIMADCKALDGNFRCTQYDNRPLICRKYSEENCDATGGDYDYEVLLETPEQVEKYARKVLGGKKFDKAREKARAKLEAKERKRREKKQKRRDRAAKKTSKESQKASGPSKGSGKKPGRRRDRKAK